MPLPNYHACEKEDSASYKIVGTKSRTHDGKKYLVRYGTPKSGDGGSTEVTYLYSKDSWTAAEAKAHCKSHDGSFVAARSAESIVEMKGYQVAMMTFAQQLIGAATESETWPEFRQQLNAAKEMLYAVMAMVPEVEEQPVVETTEGVQQVIQQAESAGSATVQLRRRESITLRQFDAKRNVWPVIVIEGGQGANGYYTSEGLAANAHKYEGAQVYANHLKKTASQKAGEPLGRSIFEFVGSIRNARWDESQNAVVGDLSVFDPEIQEKLQIPDFRAGIGLSHVSDNVMEQREIDGVLRWVVTEVNPLSVDLVMDPAQGGRFLESKRNNGNQKEVDIVGGTQDVETPEVETPTPDRAVEARLAAIETKQREIEARQRVHDARIIAQRAVEARTDLPNMVRSKVVDTIGMAAQLNPGLNVDEAIKRAIEEQEAIGKEWRGVPIVNNGAPDTSKPKGEKAETERSLEAVEREIEQLMEVDMDNPAIDAPASA